jgi:hypothetical protein
MKNPWRWLIVLFVGFGIAIVPGARGSWARPGSPFRDHGHDHDKHHHEKEHHDNGRHRGWERNGKGYYRFNDYDRGVVVRYYQGHRDERWFHERVPRGYALAYGHVLEPGYRRYCHPLPPVMLRELPPPPPRCRYFLFGGNVVLFDDGYRVHDFVHIDINLGR